MKFSLGRMVDYGQLLKELENGLRKLTFRDNFESFVETVTIPAMSEVGISNKLTTIPSWYIIGRQQGEGQIIDGDSPWTLDNIFLKNTSSNEITITVIILR